MRLRPLALALALALVPAACRTGPPATVVVSGPQHYRYDLRPGIDRGQPILFGQRGVSPRFSHEGIFHGESLDEVAAALRAGRLRPEDVPVHFMWVNGEKVALNNRSLAALSMAGLRPVRVIDMSGRLPTDGENTLPAVLQRLDEMGGRPSRTTELRETHDRDSPPRAIITIAP